VCKNTRGEKNMAPPPHICWMVGPLTLSDQYFSHTWREQDCKQWPVKIEVDPHKESERLWIGPENVALCKGSTTTTPSKLLLIRGLSEWVSEWYIKLRLAIFQLYHGRTSYIRMRWRWGWCPFCIQSTHLVGFYSASSLIQQSTGRHVALLGHIILIPSPTSLFLYSFTLWA
jgi:hypothetical protein